MDPAGRPPLEHRALTEQVIGAFYEVYRDLGAGFLESVYEAAFAIALRDVGLRVECQAPVDVWFRGSRVGLFRADLLVESAVIVELKAARSLDRAHEAQLLNLLRASSIEVGLLFNFGSEPRFKRMAYTNTRKLIRVLPRSSAATPPHSPKDGR